MTWAPPIGFIGEETSDSMLPSRPAIELVTGLCSDIIMSPQSSETYEDPAIGQPMGSVHATQADN